MVRSDLKQVMGTTLAIFTLFVLSVTYRGKQTPPFSMEHNVRYNRIPVPVSLRFSSSSSSFPTSSKFLLLFSPPPLSPLIVDSVSLRVFQVIAPQGILLYAKTEFICNYDLENDTLYTLNWFINGSEISSLRPSKQPVTEFYPLPYIDLRMNQSFSNKLVIDGFKLSGLYQISCEVTVHDSFQLESAQSNIRVIGLYFSLPFPLTLKLFYLFDLLST